LLEFGTAVEKENAMKEIAIIAFGCSGMSGTSRSKPSTTSSSEEDDSDVASMESSLSNT